MGLVLGRNLKFYTSVAKRLKLKVRTFWGLIPTFAEVTGKKLVEGALLPSHPSWIGLRSVTIKQGWVGFYYLQQLRNTYNGLVRNDSDISQWTCNLYQLSVWRLYGAFERKLIHPNIIFCEINFCAYWFLGISLFIGKSERMCRRQICCIFLPMQINPFKIFADFVI